MSYMGDLLIDWYADHVYEEDEGKWWLVDDDTVYEGATPVEGFLFGPKSTEDELFEFYDKAEAIVTDNMMDHADYLRKKQREEGLC